ncbi:CheR family methyltransferase [Andreprevotia chitinilytica]|uniref:CheR family methyltransferase n=1 Tax=Andreprevotia chitinilytica TaxID=396808 RepID=UPI00054D3EE6|nr:CheR family methyltransferase [Andreprevotia chitinilytica]
MSEPLDDTLLSRFAGFVADSVGLYFPPSRQNDLLRGLTAAAADFGYANADACMRALLVKPPSRREIELLARHLTVGETYFFREPAVFDALEQHVLPRLIQSRREAGNLRLRFWSAACCTGEEPYSLAMLLARMLPDRADWNITILGTDINPTFLQRAEAGVYPQWSFRNTPDWVRKIYFHANQSGWALRADIRRMVTFSYLNLIDDGYPSVENNTNAMDLILCRNVLMYFDQAGMRRVVQGLQRSLVEQGCLVVGAAETSQTLFADFNPIHFPDTLFYGKSNAAGGGPRPDLAPPTPSARTLIPTFAPVAPPVQQPALKPRAEAAVQVIAAPVTEPVANSPYDIALTCYNQGKYAEAAETLTDPAEALNHPMAKAESMLLLARAHANLGQLDQAAGWCEKAMAANLLDPVGPYLLAAIRDEQGQPEAAITALKRVLYLDSGFVLAHFALGNLTRRLERPKANKHFDHALELLAAYSPDSLLPEGEGMTAGRLAQIIQQRREAR